MERMNILLLDAKEFEKVEGTVFLRAHYSFNMNGLVERTWSNGWCPVTQFKASKDGQIYGRIANELVPTEVYSGCAVNAKDKILANRYNEAIAQ